MIYPGAWQSASEQLSWGCIIKSVAEKQRCCSAPHCNLMRRVTCVHACISVPDRCGHNVSRDKCHVWS